MAHSDRDYLTSSGVARILRVSPRTVDRWAEMGRIPCSVTLGGHRRFKPDDVAAIASLMGIDALPAPDAGSRS